jgi:hypothetical protein
MARQPGPTAREIESSQLVSVIAKPSRVDDIAPDFSRLCTGQKPVAVFLNDFFSGTVPADLERIYWLWPQRKLPHAPQLHQSCVRIRLRAIFGAASANSTN